MIDCRDFHRKSDLQHFIEKYRIKVISIETVTRDFSFLRLWFNDIDLINHAKLESDGENKSLPDSNLSVK
jgi:hypothetical protein